MVMVVAVTNFGGFSLNRNQRRTQVGSKVVSHESMRCYSHTFSFLSSCLISTTLLYIPRVNHLASPFCHHVSLKIYLQPVPEPWLP